MGLLQNIAFRLNRWHKRPCPSSFKGKTAQHKALGDYGERVAASYLIAHGLRLLRRNVRWGRRGELDLVMRDGGTLVFVEVKTRRRDGFMHPADAVDRHKRELLRIGAERWLRLLPNAADIPIRFDIVEVIAPAGELPECRHIREAFSAKRR